MKRLLIALALVFIASPLPADTLVLFKNGKAMRVKSVTKDGQWLKCEFEDKNFISVPASGVLRVEEAALGGSGGELRPNQVAAGTGGAYVPPPRGGSDQGPPPEMPPEEDLAAAIAEEQAAVARQGPPRPGVVGGRGNLPGGRGIPIPPGQNPGIQQGFQPLNQAGTPFQNRRLNEQRGGSRIRTQIPVEQPSSATDE